ncbi:hypothetical protein N7474_000016 [Penicillium riverlandense]|uniref:uncharacterized protein n=1 Tax=Penicillium riverlandense TaxID=1903569 RepID=UPI0025481DCD|nr:uncharacterized protein N7474_000016 [Penicillium riverlandense]KAJ5831705.1 hypothetical protein N7474_000016 [Penicillium riverlandense]
MLTKVWATSLLCLSLVAAGPIANLSVLSDLTTVKNNVQTLDKDVKSWDGTLITALSMLDDVKTLESDLKTAISDTKAASAFSTSDSTTATKDIASLKPIISTTLDDLVGKKSDIANIGETSTVKSSLKELKNLSDQLGTALEAKATSNDADTIKSAVSAIDSDFTTAISAF